MIWTAQSGNLERGIREEVGTETPSALPIAAPARMKILLINHYSGPSCRSSACRSSYLARGWADQGHEVTVVAASYSHFNLKGVGAEEEAGEGCVDGVRYIWLKTPRYRGNGRDRQANMLAFLVQLFRETPRLARELQPDVVIAASTYLLDTIPAKLIARRTRGVLIREIRDLWPLSLTELGGMSRRHPFILLLQAAENYSYRTADYVVSTLPCAEAHMREHGLLPGKFSCIPNGVDVTDWLEHAEPVPDEHRQALAQLREQKRFVVGYSGGHGLANSLWELLAAAERVREHPLSFVLVGDGPEKQNLQDRVRELRLDNVLFLPPVRKLAVPSMLALMDALYIGWPRNPIYRFGISPNKLGDYLMAGRPVIHAVDAGNDPVTESGCGLSVPPDDPGALAAAVLELAARSPDERAAMGDRGRAFAEQNYDYRVLARRFLDLMHQRAASVAKR